MPFFERAQRLERRFKATIALIFVVGVAGLFIAVPRGRNSLWWLVQKTRWGVMRSTGFVPHRDEIESVWRTRRLQGIEQTRADAAAAVARSPVAFQRLLRRAGMIPSDAVIRWGNFDRTFMLASTVFEVDDTGRSYKLRPNVRSVWLKQRALPKPETGLLLIPDTPEIRRLAAQANTTILAGSEQSTNSWGCRGPEPDLKAPVRGLVIGDSFMQGLLVDDAHSPPASLERSLAEELDVPVSILNTGVLGYSPEQYYFTLVEFLDRFQPSFVLVSVFANDFGDPNDPDRSEWTEAQHWLRKIQAYCVNKNVLCVLSPIVGHAQLRANRHFDGYPNQILQIVEISSEMYLDPIEEFVTENLRTTVELSPEGHGYVQSPLYNLNLGDGHFNAAGTALWGRILSRRLAPLLKARLPNLRPAK